MKQAVSVSLGQAKRDKEVEVTLLGQQVKMWREGFDGDLGRATARFTELDGRVDAIGVGGIDLWIGPEHIRYPLHAAHKLIQGVKKTPVVDGCGLKNTLEGQVTTTLKEQLGISSGRVLLTAGVDRYGMTKAFFEQGYDCLCGDLGFALDIPIAIRSFRMLHLVLRLIGPIVSRLPISVLYPTGEKQDQNTPKFGNWYAWADIIAGDCHYIKRYMPADLKGKIIVTNTTTEQDRQLFQERGVKALVTTTPVMNGRSFGTNMLEAALTAVAGKGRPLSTAELNPLLQELHLTPTAEKF